jgi:hypothetical protein
MHLKTPQPATGIRSRPSGDGLRSPLFFARAANFVAFAGDALTAAFFSAGKNLAAALKTLAVVAEEGGDAMAVNAGAG